MKKILCLALAVLMTATIASCAPSEPAEPDGIVPPPPTEGGASEEPAGNETAAAPADYKIGIITGTVSQNEEEYRAAENMKAKYGDMIVTSTYPDNFTQETETLISSVMSLADAGAQAIVFVQAVPGASAAIDKVRELYPNVLFVAGVPGEDPGVIASKADVVLQADELGMGTTIIAQAKAMGAETFVHYSFPRHMSYALLSARREIFREECEKEGILFVDATAPDPTSDMGVPGAQQFILEDVPRMVEQYGVNTAFFSTNCSMQEPLIKSVLQTGALYPQQCCPSPYHGYPGALGIEIPEDKKGDVDYAVEQITAKIAEGGGTGRFSTWPVPINMVFVEAGVEYARAYLNGEVSGRNDADAVKQNINAICDNKATITTYDENGEAYDNFYMVLSDFINF